MNASIIDNYGDFQAVKSGQFNLIDNYIYLYHTDTLIILPTFPETISDNISTSYASTTIIGRSAPIYSFTNSGPRTVDFQLKLHRDMMNQINIDKNAYTYGLKFFEEDSDNKLKRKLARKDYVDLMINELQSISVPSYLHGQKMVDPPLVAIRIGDEIFCKGIVEGGVSTGYEGPILANPLYNENGDYIIDEVTGKRAIGKGKYAVANISFKITEVDPYDASTIAQFGSMHGLNRSLERNLYRIQI